MQYKRFQGKKNNVILLADALENLSDECKDIYGLDLVHFYT